MTVRVDGNGHTPHEKGLRMRILGPEKGMHPDDILLPIQSLEVMGNGHQVGLGGKVVGRVSPVPVGENSQVSTIYKIFDFFLDRSKIHGR